MNIGEQIRKNLELKLKSLKEKTQNVYSLADNVNEFSVSCDIRDYDKFSFIIEALRLTNNGREQPISKREFEKGAIEFSQKLTYLTDELHLVEIDTQKSIALMRSKLSDNQRQPLPYFEIKLYGTGTAELARFVLETQKKTRDKVSFQFGKETFERILNDFAEFTAI